MAKRLTVLDFFKKYPTEESCLDHVMETRYGLESQCPKCGKDTKFYRIKKRPAYACEFCGHHVYPCAGTPFENTRTPLQMWFYAIYLFTTSKHGVPAKELQRQLGVTYKTAWRMGHQIRKYMAKVDGDDDIGGHVEMDETYVGGRKRGMGGYAAHSKTVVFGMVERGGKIVSKVIDRPTKANMFPLIDRFVRKGSMVSTDEFRAYKTLRKRGYTHGFVRHYRDEWVRGDIHTNTIDSFWARFKLSVRGTHVHVSKRHMQKYLGEFEFRFNHRDLSSEEMLEKLMAAF